MAITTRMKSDVYSTSGLGGQNFVITIDAVTPDQAIIHPVHLRPLGGRTTIELHNSGGEDCYIYFLGSTPTNGRILGAGQYVAFALADSSVLYAQASATTVDLRVTEII